MIEKYKNELVELYSRYEGEFIKTSKMDGFREPHLIYPTEEYLKSKIRLFFVGREAIKWGNNFISVRDSMETYKAADLLHKKDESLYANRTKLNRHRIELSILLGNTSHPYRSYLNCNLNRFDFDGKEPCVKDVVVYDPLIKEEISIIEPHVCIFDCGVRFNSRLEKTFGPLNLEELIKGCLYKINNQFFKDKGILPFLAIHFTLRRPGGVSKQEKIEIFSNICSRVLETKDESLV